MKKMLAALILMFGVMAGPVKTEADHGVSFEIRRHACKYTITKVGYDTYWTGEWHPYWKTNNSKFPHGVCLWKWSVKNYTDCVNRMMHSFGTSYTNATNFCGYASFPVGGCYPWPSGAGAKAACLDAQ